MSRSWRLGGLVYTLAVVASVVLRLWRPSGLSPQIFSAVVSISDFSTLPPFIAGIGVYPGLIVADVLQQLTGLPASHLLVSGAAWAVIVLSAVAVAATDVFLAHAVWRLIRRGCRRRQLRLGT